MSAVLDAISSDSAPNSITLEEIRRIIREELQEVSLVAAPFVFQPVKAELTKEEQAENEKSVLDDLEMFG